MTHSTDPPISSATARQGGIPLATAVQAFDWTRKLPTDMRGFVTFWLETDNRVVSHVSIVAAGGAR